MSADVSVGLLGRACPPREKKALIGGLGAGFVVMTLLVWLDPTPSPPLQGAALAGRHLWHAKACQLCHQLHGFGGFLGPDLTNAAARLPPGRLASVLSNGGAAMPAFHLGADEIASIGAFLEAMDDTGRGQARASSSPPSFRDIVAETVTAKGSPAMEGGLSLYASRACGACHAPESLLPTPGPDLTLVARRLSPQQLTEVLVSGRPERGMPNPNLSADEVETLATFLTWLAEQREGVMGAMTRRQSAATLGDLPWWEFR